MPLNLSQTRSMVALGLILISGLSAAQVAPNAPTSLCVDDACNSGGGGAPYALGSLPSELSAIRWPNSPTISSEVRVSTQAQLNSALSQNRVRIVVAAGQYQSITVSGTDKEIVFQAGAVLSPTGSTAVTLSGAQRLIIRGGDGRGGMTVSGSSDVLIDGLTLNTKRGSSEWGDSIEILNANRFALINSNFSAYRYCGYIENTTDLILANNTLASDGPESTFRNVQNTRVVAVDNRLSNGQKHNFRVHSGSDLVYFARNRLVGGGIMIANMSNYEANRVWVTNNTIFHDTTNLIAVSTYPAVTRATVTNNTFYTTSCLSTSGCGQAGGIGTGPGWVVNSNPQFPFRTPF